MSSCNINYSCHNVLDYKRKTINGNDYLFSAGIKYKNINLFGFKQRQFQVSIDFYGLGNPIHKELNIIGFEKKMDIKEINSLQLDSVTFSLNEERDNVDLSYFLNLNNTNQTVSNSLIRINDDWELIQGN